MSLSGQFYKDAILARTWRMNRIYIVRKSVLSKKHGNNKNRKLEINSHSSKARLIRTRGSDKEDNGGKFGRNFERLCYPGRTTQSS